ncbi:hypothetical protein B0H67DRAFT_640450 [Lasiosphaeris hirsuta]|uniref:Rhodopsin domain-containing protein n=1 Tax=Lasiosphaeris hirsuta TaxID=260670 RepID=A0AA40BD92_9PEZI|nr:hypothetical protein B0H67DRAFT_640450 [Lasiosphaeris hirsuta]
MFLFSPSFSLGILEPTVPQHWFYLAQLVYNPILALRQGLGPALTAAAGRAKAGRAARHLRAQRCLSTEANWDCTLQAQPDTRCIDHSFHIIASAITILIDILVVALPFWIFLGLLKMSRAAKISVVGNLPPGRRSVTVISIIRLVTIYQLFYVV